MSIQNINWNYPTSIWFGLNRIKEIQKACDELNISNPLIVTDPGILQTDIITKINHDRIPSIILRTNKKLDKVSLKIYQRRSYLR